MIYTIYLIVFGAIAYGTLSKAGLLPTLGDLKAERDRLRALKEKENFPYANYWNHNYWQEAYKERPGGFTVYTESTLKRLAADIYRAKATRYTFGLTISNDDEDKVFSIFRSFPSKANVSQLSFVFYKTYSKDLYNYLESFMSNSELAMIREIIEGKPLFDLKK